jgi:hypothetical protein
MKQKLSLFIATLALAALACNSLINLPVSSVKTIPTETFSIDESVPADATVTDATLVMAPSSATLALAGGANGLVEGEIIYNVAEWKPTLTASDGILRITQEPQDDKLYSVSGEAVNEWNLKLGNGIVNVRVECPAGKFTLDFADTLPDGANIIIDMGAGDLRLVVPAEVAASVEVQRGPSNVTTEGAWTVNGSAYTISGSGPTWIIKLEMGVGNLTLVSQ